MCDEICRNSYIGFRNICKDDFNKFSEVMDYFENKRSIEDCCEITKKKLAKFIARSLGFCPKYIFRE